MTTPTALRQLIEDHHDQAESAHSRLRKDLDGVGKKVSDLETQHTNLLLRVTAIERTPLNIEKVTFSSVQLVVIVGACLSIAVGMWTLRVGINDVQTTVANAAKLQDERNATQKETLDNLGRQIEMRRVEIQRVRDDLAEFVRGKPQRREP